MRVVIVAAGIGGLAAAVALQRGGVETLIVGRAAEIGEVGAGLSLWSNAINASRELGVENKVLASGSVVGRILSQTLTGRHVGVTDLSEISRSAEAACVCIRRAALYQIPLEKLPSSAVRTGMRCIGFEGWAAVLEDGQRIEGDIVVGADGIFSVIRDQLRGTAEPRYAGYTCWRGIYHGQGVLPDRTSLLAVGCGSQFGPWPCGAGQFYWFLRKNSSRRGSKAKPGSPRTSAIIRDSQRSGRILQLDHRLLEVLRNWFMGSWLGKHLVERTFRELILYRVPTPQPPKA